MCDWSSVAAYPGWAATDSFDQPAAVQPALQFVGEQQVGQLGLPVGLPAAILAALPIEVVEVDDAQVVHIARHRDDAIGDAPEQQAGEREMTEMICPDLHFEAVGGACVRHGHHPGVVDEHIDPVDGVGEFAHRGQVGEIEPAHLGERPDPIGDRLALVDIAAGEHHPRTRAGQGARGHGAEPAVGAGDDEGPALLIGDVGDAPASHAASLATGRHSRGLRSPRSVVTTTRP